MNLIELFFYKLFEFYKNIFFLYLYFYFIYLNIFLLNLILYIYLDLKEKKNVYIINLNMHVYYSFLGDNHDINFFQKNIINFIFIKRT